MKLVISLCIFAFLSHAIDAQGVAHPSPNDPYLYYGAMRLVRALHQYSLTKTDPSEVRTIQYALRKELQINEQDYALLVRETADVDSQEPLKWALAKDGTTTGISVHTGESTPVDDRLTTVNKKIQTLKREMSSEGWLALISFVNGRFRQSTTMVSQSK